MAEPARILIGDSGQRRYVTVLFADLSGSTSLGDLMEAEHYADLLGVIRALCREIIRKHGGNVARLQGDGILVVFGFPESREDDGRRAVDAALELHEAVSRIALSGHAASTRVLALHSGIHSGLTLVRDGGVEVGTLEVLGDVPNVAANLSSVAQRGEIIVSAETLGPQAHFFQTEPRKIAVKGRSGPLHAYRVSGQRNLKRRFDAHAIRGLAPFVGREAELQMLTGCLQARTETPRCVAVVGGPGLGQDKADRGGAPRRARGEQHRAERLLRELPCRRAAATLPADPSRRARHQAGAFCQRGGDGSGGSARAIQAPERGRPHGLAPNTLSIVQRQRTACELGRNRGGFRRAAREPGVTRQGRV